MSFLTPLFLLGLARLGVPARLWAAPNEAVTAYLRSLFQADGYVTVQGGSGRVAFAVISERWTAFR